MKHFLGKAKDKEQKSREIFIEIRINSETTTGSICAESAEDVQKLLTECQKAAFDMLMLKFFAEREVKHEN
jgi:hypothetical protein